MKDSYYDLIGVERHATQAQIESACLQLGEKFRPDKLSADAVALAAFHDIEQAYAVLSDPIARRVYDAKLSADGYAPPTDNFGGVSHPVKQNAWSILWTSRSRKTKVLIVFLCFAIFGNLVAVVEKRTGSSKTTLTEAKVVSERDRIARVPDLPRPDVRNRLTPEEAGNFWIHMRRLGATYFPRNLQERDDLAMSGRITLQIVSKVIDNSSASPTEKLACKNRFAETMLTVSYMNGYIDMYEKTEGSRDVESRILQSLRGSVGCSV